MPVSQHADPSPIERKTLDDSDFDAIYPPDEKIPAIVVNNFPELGRLTALRFLEWVHKNPEGVISLPTGKTPEYFIRWVTYLLNNWEDSEVQRILDETGLDLSSPPRMDGLRFVQIDEFYPIEPDHEHSFYSYVNRFYIDRFGLDPDRAQLINCEDIGLPDGKGLYDVWPGGRVDLSLRYREPQTWQEQLQQQVLFNVDEWCQRYENRIREMGGIGFFLGGIGPDGHIAFNVRGSDHHSTTRLTATNYETEAAAATDQGGMEMARNRRVITIGLGTITYNPDCVALIIAAGHAKADVVADAIQKEPDVRFPATALHELKNARFYLTHGAARLLEERQFDEIGRRDEISDDEVERVLINLAVRLNKRLIDLKDDDFRNDRFASLVVGKRQESPADLARMVHRRLERKINRGSKTLQNRRFLHTEPHHDDLMLGYLPSIVRHGRDPSNTHHFATLTSGFTAVTDSFIDYQLQEANELIDSAEFSKLARTGYFDPGNEECRQRDVWQYLDGIASESPEMKAEGTVRRLVRDIAEVYDIDNLQKVKEKISSLKDYLREHRPGEKDSPHVQKLKGMRREWEAECLWAYFGWNCTNVRHLRLGFYTGDIFTEEPDATRDVPPVVDLLHEVRPDILTVALDPEGSGPDTHYKVLQVVSDSLRRYVRESDSAPEEVWGYRNVWHRFHPAEADLTIPVSLNMFSTMDDAFMNTFSSQRNAPFPSYEHDGPFCELAQEIQVDQYQTLKTCLGREWFHNHPDALIRATRGVVHLKKMEVDEFYRKSRKLRQFTENSLMDQ